MRRLLRMLVAAAGGRWLYRQVVEGRCTVDTGIGRRERPLGPIVVTIDAPRDLVFDVLATPYLGRAPREVAEKIDVLERGADMVVAAHRTPAGNLVATTVEAVRFERPHAVHFRLLRGPVPEVVEQFVLDEDDTGTTRLEYRGHLATDFWAVGQRWGDLVAKQWEAAVRSTLDHARTSAEQRAAAARGRAGTAT